MPEVKSLIEIENARIAFRNFSGKPGRFNPAGNRNFCVFLDEELAKTLARDGWNVKHLKPYEPEDAPQAYLQVSVGYANYPPKIMLIKTRSDGGDTRTYLDESTVNVLDFADIENVDLIIRPYNWSVNDKEGVKAYIKSMYVVIRTDRFEEKYTNVPDSALDVLEEPPYDE